MPCIFSSASIHFPWRANSYFVPLLQLVFTSALLYNLSVTKLSSYYFVSPPPSAGKCLWCLFSSQSFASGCVDISLFLCSCFKASSPFPCHLQQHMTLITAELQFAVSNHAVSQATPAFLSLWFSKSKITSVVMRSLIFLSRQLPSQSVCFILCIWSLTNLQLLFSSSINI